MRNILITLGMANRIVVAQLATWILRPPDFAFATAWGPIETASNRV